MAGKKKLKEPSHHYDVTHQFHLNELLQENQHFAIQKTKKRFFLSFLTMLANSFPHVEILIVVFWLVLLLLSAFSLFLRGSCKTKEKSFFI